MGLRARTKHFQALTMHVRKNKDANNCASVTIFLSSIGTLNSLHQHTRACIHTYTHASPIESTIPVSGKRARRRKHLHLALQHIIYQAGIHHFARYFMLGMYVDIRYHSPPLSQCPCNITITLPLSTLSLFSHANTHAYTRRRVL